MHNNSLHANVEIREWIVHYYWVPVKTLQRGLALKS